MLRIKKKSHIRAIGLIGVAATALGLILKLMHTSAAPMQERMDMGILLLLIVGFSLINSSALLELRGKVDALGRKR